jgi:DNA processing protein
MGELRELAATVALARKPGQTSAALSDAIEEAGSALTLLERREGLLAELALHSAETELGSWMRQGIQAFNVLDQRYPANLRAVHDRPPLLFSAGALLGSDERAVAVIGSRRASEQGLQAAGALARALASAGFTVASGLAAGIDTAAHFATLEAGARTIAVIGTGLRHCYPPQNRALQAQIAAQGAVVSRFWPEDRPSRASFPLRNALMSGLSLANVIVEAGERSGCRIQARAALGHGRPVFIRRALLSQPWARELASRPGVKAFEDPGELVEALERLGHLMPLAG